MTIGHQDFRETKVANGLGERESWLYLVLQSKDRIITFLYDCKEV
jgi:hypothetical protein